MADQPSGITDVLRSNIDGLGRLLGEAIRVHDGDEQFELVEALRRQCKEAVENDDPAMRRRVRDTVAGLSMDQLERTVRAFSAFFRIVNKAEQTEIVRINRQRALDASRETPRAESIAEAFADLADDGISSEAARETVSRLDIQPTLTAHPTEARRQSVLDLQERLAALLRRRNRETLTPQESADLSAELARNITTLLLTDELRRERRTVEDEIEFGIYFCATSIWEALPRIARDLHDALGEYFDAVDDLPAVVKYRSWIGGDRDGNPRVTPEVTRETLGMQRETVLELYLDEVKELHRELSISAAWKESPEELRESIRRDADEIDLQDYEQHARTSEPYRHKLAYMHRRLELAREASFEGEEVPYDARRFLDDLELLARCLQETDVDPEIHRSRLGDLIVRARTFGFRLMTLDIRQHSGVHERAVAELLAAGGVDDGYADADESRRRDILISELRNPRPLRPRGTRLSEKTEELLEVFELIRDAQLADPDAIRSYVVSMTHDVSDLLEVLLLAKETGLWSWDGGDVHAGVDVVPLFETIEDLQRCGEFMDEIFRDDLYREHVRARGDYQEMMLGYSDSNKDGGYWMANWALREAQRRLSEACREHEVDFCLFHGRGGTVGRGGGRANQAILSLPPRSHTGHIRFTEQGEVISFRYAMQELAHRHLEQVVNAMVRATARAESHWEGADAAEEADLDELMSRLGQRSMEAYRELIDDSDFFAWYREVTPIEHISRLPIASRPVSRAGEGELEFEGLRAIPWNFAWTQTRYNAPGWYGLGTAIHEAVEEGATSWEALREMYQTRPFFQAVLRNAELEMARGRLAVARAYAELSERAEIHQRLEDEFRRSEAAILEITGEDRLLARNPVIRELIDIRNPYTDVLNLMQIELMRRWSATEDEEECERIGGALLWSINGIAAAMQSTG